MLRVTEPDVLDRLDIDPLLAYLVRPPGHDSPVGECARRASDTNQRDSHSQCKVVELSRRVFDTTGLIPGSGPIQ